MAHTIVGHECPKCGCRKIRLITETIMRHDLTIRREDGVYVVDMPLMTLDLHTQELEPRTFAGVCSNPKCGEVGGEPDPCEFYVSMNPREIDGKMHHLVRVRKAPADAVRNRRF